MRPVTVADEDVVTAGRRLQAEEKAVNGWSLRSAIGRGRPKRLAEVWQRAQADTAPPARGEERDGVALPPGVAEMAAHARGEIVARFDGIVLAACRQIEDGVKARYKADFERLTDERATGAAQLEQASSILEASDERAAAAEAEVAELRLQLAGAREEIASVTTRATAAEDRVRALSDQVGDAQGKEAAAREAAASAEATVRMTERENMRFQEEVTAQRATLDQIRGETAVLQRSAAQASADHASLTARLEAATARGVQVEADRDTARAEATSHAERLAALAERAGAAEARAQAAEQRAATAEGAFGKALDDLEAMRMRAIDAEAKGGA